MDTPTQAEADALLALEKRRQDETVWLLPEQGNRLSIPIVSLDGREAFLLDISRSRIILEKGTYQHRARKTVILARLDFGGPPHRNPDDQEIAGTHLHIYREGYGDKWAFPVSPAQFPNITDRWLMLQNFMGFCNIVQAPHLQRGLFS